jgi:hypothetical protein
MTASHLIANTFCFASFAWTTFSAWIRMDAVKADAAAEANSKHFPGWQSPVPGEPIGGRGRGFRFDGGARQLDSGWADAGRGKSHAGPSGQSFRPFVRYCAICLGKQPHDRVRCAATSVASGKHRRVATCDNSGHFIVRSNSTSVAMCLDYSLGHPCVRTSTTPVYFRPSVPFPGSL